MQLTKSEEQIMRILWTVEEATVQDILHKFRDPKPARTTIATLLAILENKRFAEHRSEGRINVYRATVSKDEYSKSQLSGFIKNYFDGSFSSMISFFAKKSNLSLEEVDALLQQTREELAAEDNTQLP